MTEEKLSPFKLTRSRLLLLFFILLALATILASIFGGLSGYQAVKEVARPIDGTAAPASP